MKISILEYDLSKISGRQQTLVSGFADTFSQLGHFVKIYGNFLQGHIPSRDNLLHYHLANHLTMDNFDFSHEIQRLSLEGMPLKEWNNSDLLLIPYPGYSWLGKHVTCPIITWFIAKPKRWFPEYVKRVWTNSWTQKKRLNLEQATVVYAPHDYSLFRKLAKPWNKRPVDVLLVTSIRKMKEKTKFLSDELKQAERLSSEGLNVLGLFLAKTSDEFRLLQNLNFKYYVNLPRRYVAGFMASSKILFHPSPMESCSLVLFEALNAGMFPVAKIAGACKEQLGRVGLYYDRFTDADIRFLKQRVKNDYKIETSISQGLKFDRKSNIHVIEEELSLCQQ